MPDKKRIDVYLYEKGLAPSREKAKAYIIAGHVFVDGIMCSKPSATVTEEQDIELRGGDEFVSRGGKKLQKAVESFGLELEGKVAIDVGASTGGFTDCMLRAGASFVYAVDVGYGQLAWKLRNDERVCVMERTNARYLEKEMFEKEINFASIDVSFISIKLILPVLKRVLTAPYKIAALIKPQFEAGRKNVGKKGVVRDKDVHVSVIEDILEFAKISGFTICGLDYSPIKGPAGNIEYLACLSDSAEDTETSVQAIVDAAHDSSL